MPDDARSPEQVWCRVCCTRHQAGGACQGPLGATGPERQGWHVVVDTPRGTEAYGVLVAPAGRLWRARIVTYPNFLWMIPGGGGSMKFAASTARDAEKLAIAFLEEHCRERGYSPRTPAVPAESGPVGPEVARGFRNTGPAPRKQRALPVRFLSPLALEPAVTANVSESGMFVVSPSPLDPGAPVRMNVEFDAESIALRGQVVWARRHHETGRPLGMGIRLVEPPALYVRCVRTMP